MSDQNSYQVDYTSAEMGCWDRTAASGYTWQEAIHNWADDYLRPYTVEAETQVTVEREGIMVIKELNDLDWWLVKACIVD